MARLKYIVSALFFLSFASFAGPGDAVMRTKATYVDPQTGHVIQETLWEYPDGTMSRLKHDQGLYQPNGGGHFRQPAPQVRQEKPENT